MLLTLNLIFALVALAIGFVGGIWFTGGRGSGGSGGSDGEWSDALQAQRHLDAERTTLATERLRDLSKGMASDVGTHSSKVEVITKDLKALDLTDPAAMGEGLVTALSQIVSANEELQQRLANAEKQITEQAQEIQVHETEARTDSLTQLANRRAFDDELKRRYSEWQRRATPFSLLILDIDHFKSFNDTHGHQAGDEVLRQVGSSLTEVCREMDLPCRYGGEEFAVIMPATIVKEGKVLAERVRKAIGVLSVNFEGKRLKVTASVGLSQVTNQDDCDRIVKRADEALYQSKEAGRNCGHWHDGELSQPIILGDKKSKPTKLPAATPMVATKVLDGLPSRTMFIDELRRRVAESLRAGSPLSIVVLEVQGVEEVRREFGEVAASLLLDSVAEYISGVLREMDLLARLSENKFAVMIPGSETEGAVEVAERAIRALDKCSLPVGDASLELRMLFGTARVAAVDTVETLVERAELQLQRSEKQSSAAK